MLSSNIIIKNWPDTNLLPLAFPSDIFSLHLIIGLQSILLVENREVMATCTEVSGISAQFFASNTRYPIIETFRKRQSC